VEITCRVYRPRRPRESPLFRLVEQHLEELLRVWPTHFVRQHGSLRPVVERVLREFLKCGLLEHGNPHITCSPPNMKTAARNITIGLIRNDPAGKECYEANLEAFLKEIDRRLFGQELVELLGAETLFSMAEKGALLPFLERQKFRGTPLIDYLGGWMKRMLPLRGMEIVTYHKNWVYFLTLFSVKEAGTVEPKPGIPPSPRHVTELVDLMRVKGIRIILAANYFDEQKIRTVAKRVGAVPVIVPLYVGGEEGVDDDFQLVDLWTKRMVEAAAKVGRAPAEGPESPRGTGS